MTHAGARRLAGWTLARVAEAAGVGLRSASRFERGQPIKLAAHKVRALRSLYGCFAAQAAAFVEGPR